MGTSTATKIRGTHVFDTPDFMISINLPVKRIGVGRYSL